MAMHDDVDVSKIAMYTVVGALLVVVTILGVHVLYANLAQAEDYTKRVSQTPRMLRDYRAEQESKLHGYRWVDRNAQTVAIPIGRAMQLVTRELASARKAAQNAPAPKVESDDGAAATPELQAPRGKPRKSRNGSEG